jgi:AcrR family transcriptional regulator/ketosteroid isomerase-like protein
VTGPGNKPQTRGEPRERAILSAVIELLGETGYEAMTMDAVAARAHASKTTIYRRWPGKPELVRAAVDALVAGQVLDAADTGSLRGDLLAVMGALRGHLTPQFMAMMSGLVHAMRVDTDLADRLRSLFDQDQVSGDIIGRAARRGELPADAVRELANLVHEVIEAQVFRQMMAGADLDEAFALHVTDDIVMPLLAGRVAPAKPTRGPDVQKGAAAMSLAAFDPQELELFTRTFENLFQAGDPDSMTSYYAQDAQLMADGIQPIRGHAEIGEFWRAAIDRAAAAKARRIIRLHESSSSGDLGYALCTVTVEVPAENGGSVISAWDATIWRRDPGGQWQIAVDISTRLPPR